MVLYFAYGSNMGQDDLNKRCDINRWNRIDISQGEKALLREFELKFNYFSPFRNGGVANIEPKENSFVWGILLDLTDFDFDTMCKKEGAPVFYKPIEVEIEFNGKIVKAKTFTVTKEQRVNEHVQPTDYYHGVMLSGAKEFGLPSEWIEFLSGFNSLNP